MELWRPRNDLAINVELDTSKHILTYTQNFYSKVLFTDMSTPTPTLVLHGTSNPNQNSKSNPNFSIHPHGLLLFMCH